MTAIPTAQPASTDLASLALTQRNAAAYTPDDLLFDSEFASAQHRPAHDSRRVDKGASDPAREESESAKPEEPSSSDDRGTQASVENDPADGDADGPGSESASGEDEAGAGEAAESDVGGDADVVGDGADASSDAALAAVGLGSAAASADGAAPSSGVSVVENPQALPAVGEQAVVTNKSQQAVAPSSQSSPSPLLETAGLQAVSPQPETGSQNDAGGDANNRAASNNTAATLGGHSATPGTAALPFGPALASSTDASSNHGEAARSAPPSASPGGLANALNPQDGDNNALNSARLSRGLRSAVSQQGGSVTLRLTPPELGTVRIQMQIQGTSVAARFHAETDGARQLLQQQLGQLRTTLESHGLTVDRLNVQSMSGSGASQFTGTDQDGGSSEGRSRGQYAQQQGNGQSSPDQESGEPRRDDVFADLLINPERS